jgi:hypothetical protein
MVAVGLAALVMTLLLVTALAVSFMRTLLLPCCGAGPRSPWRSHRHRPSQYSRYVALSAFEEAESVALVNGHEYPVGYASGHAQSRLSSSWPAPVEGPLARREPPLIFEG